MSYQPKNFNQLLGTPGFSDALLKNHFKLYEAYVQNTNKLLDQMESLSHRPQESPSPELSEIKRRFGWEFNGMRLHEYYFGNMKMGNIKEARASRFFHAIEKDFGSFDAWQKDFKATGSMRGIGWALTVFDPTVERYLNLWVNEHDAGHLAGLPLILIMDVFEHAFMIDYGLKKADYIEAFLKAIHWEEVDSRVEQASLIHGPSHA